jgi:hypothetical protein
MCRHRQSIGIRLALTTFVVCGGRAGEAWADVTEAGAGDGVASLPAGIPPAWASSLLRLEPPAALVPAKAPDRSLTNCHQPASARALDALGDAATQVSLLGFSETSALNYLGVRTPLSTSCRDWTRHLLDAIRLVGLRRQPR